ASSAEGLGSPSGTGILVKVNAEKVAVTLPQEEGQDNDSKGKLECTYTSSLPIIELDPTSPTLFRFVSTSFILDRLIGRLPSEDSSGLVAAVEETDARLSLFFNISLLLQELHRAQGLNARLSRDFARAAKEKEQLEEEMRHTIRAFQLQLDSKP
ncbi:hypothetical protein ETH_00043045, partial [Eimeria tenella]